MATALKKIEPAPLQVSESAAVFSLIERLSTDPSVSVERVEQLFALYEKMQAAAARKSYAAELAAMQPTLPVVGRKGKSHNGKFARWEDIVQLIMPKLQAHGFAISFRTACADKAITVTAVLSHRDGHSEETSLTLPADTSGSKNPIQAIGSTTSYGKRYTASALLNIVSRDEDDDANAAIGASVPITDEQVAELIALADSVGADKARFCKFYGIESFADIQQSQFAQAKTAIQAKRK